MKKERKDGGWLNISKKHKKIWEWGSVLKREKIICSIFQKVVRYECTQEREKHKYLSWIYREREEKNTEKGEKNLAGIGG